MLWEWLGTTTKASTADAGRIVVPGRYRAILLEPLPRSYFPPNDKVGLCRRQWSPASHLYRTVTRVEGVLAVWYTTIALS